MSSVHSRYQRDLRDLPSGIRLVLFPLQAATSSVSTSDGVEFHFAEGPESEGAPALRDGAQGITRSKPEGREGQSPPHPGPIRLLLFTDYSKQVMEMLKQHGKHVEYFEIDRDGGHAAGIVAIGKAGEVLRKFLSE